MFWLMPMHIVHSALRPPTRCGWFTHIDPKPFIWTASAKDILTKVTRAKAALATVAG